MREIRSSGSVRGASGDGRPYREPKRAMQDGEGELPLWVEAVWVDMRHSRFARL
jgi:hypothetical protein